MITKFILKYMDNLKFFYINWKWFFSSFIWMLFDLGRIPTLPSKRKKKKGVEIFNRPLLKNLETNNKFVSYSMQEVWFKMLKINSMLVNDLIM